MTTEFSIKEITSKNKVKFHLLKDDKAYYKISFSGAEYMFPVPLDDIGESTLFAEDKAILFMKYIREAIENREFVRAS